jgi:hypothetical protein
MYQYKNITFDDAVSKEDDGINAWSQVCNKCVDKHHIEQDKLSPVPSECICGVEGCENEADYYIDFDDEELKEIN